MEGLSQASHLADNLLTVAEEGGVEKWAQRKIEQGAQELLEMVRAEKEMPQPERTRLSSQAAGLAERVSERALREALESR